MNRLNKAMHFEATNETGNSIEMDGSPDIGGENKGVRPMELLLMGVAGCSSIDIVMILKKMRQNLIDIKVEVDGEKEKAETYSFYKTIHAHYKLYGDLDEKKVKKAIDLSLDKYCSVSKIMEKTATITSSFEIINE